MKFESTSEEEVLEEEVPPSKITTREQAMHKLKMWAMIGVTALHIGKVEVSALEAYFPNDVAKVEEARLSWQPTSAERDEVESYVEFLLEEFPGMNVADYIWWGHYDAQDEQNETRPKELVLEGFDAESFNLDEHELRSMWSEEYYPLNTLKGNVDTVRFVDEHEKFDGQYGLDSLDIAASVTLYRNVATFFKGSLANIDTSRAQKMAALDGIFTHEYGHLNDWKNSANYSPAERYELLVDVVREYNKMTEDEIKKFSGYVALISDDDKSQEKYFKVSEFWAEITERYLSLPTFLRYNNPDLFQLAEKWLKRDDPTFDVVASSDHRFWKFKMSIDKDINKEFFDNLSPVRERLP